MLKSKILLTNDDGYRCTGLLALYKELSSDYSVTIVAPEGKRNWIGKAIIPTTTKVRNTQSDGQRFFSVDGSPANCAQIGIYNLGEKPDLVISGINIGENAGLGWVLSSGTVGAAMEAALQKVPAIAVSYQFPVGEREGVDFDDRQNIHLFENAAIIAKKIVGGLMKHGFLEKADLFIINIPYKVAEGTEVVVGDIDNQSHGQLFHKEGDKLKFESIVPDYSMAKPGTDLQTIKEGKVSVVAVKLRLSSEDSFAKELREELAGL